MNLGILNNDQRKEKIKTKIRRYIEENNGGQVNPTILWDALKVVIRGQLIAETVHVKKVKSEAHRIQSENLRQLEQEYQSTDDPKVYQKIKETRMKIKEMMIDEIEKKNKFLKQNFYEVGPKATKI